MVVKGRSLLQRSALARGLLSKPQIEKEAFLVKTFQAHLKPTSKVFVQKTWSWKGRENVAKSKVGFRVQGGEAGSLGFRV